MAAGDGRAVESARGGDTSWQSPLVFCEGVDAGGLGAGAQAHRAGIDFILSLLRWIVWHSHMWAGSSVLCV